MREFIEHTLCEWPFENKQFKIAFASKLISGQVKRLIYIQTDIIKSKASAL